MHSSIGTYWVVQLPGSRALLPVFLPDCLLVCLGLMFAFPLGFTIHPLLLSLLFCFFQTSSFSSFTLHIPPLSSLKRLSPTFTGCFLNHAAYCTLYARLHYFSVSLSLSSSTQLCSSSLESHAVYSIRHSLTSTPACLAPPHTGILLGGGGEWEGMFWSISHLQSARSDHYP